MPPKKAEPKQAVPKKATAPMMMTQGDVDRLLEANEALTEAVRALSREKFREDTVSASFVSAPLSRHRPPKYDGMGGPAVLEDWLRKFEKLFTTVGCLNELRVDQAACYLRSRADLWWYDNQAQLRLYYDAVANGDDEFGWASFRKALRDEFFPEHLRHAKRTEFDNFKQREGTTVKEYYAEFMDLASYSSDLKMSDEVLAARFERGLAMHILEKIPAGIPTTVRDIYLKAGHAQRLCDLKRDLRAEKRKNEGGDSGGHRLKRGAYNQPLPRPRRSSSPKSRGESQSVTSPVSRGGTSGGHGKSSGVREYNCRRCLKNHPGKLCDGRPVIFFECGRLGHRAFECYQRGTGGDGQSGDYRAPSASKGSVAQPRGSQWRGGGVRGYGSFGGGQQQSGNVSSFQDEVSSSREGFGGRGRGSFGGLRPATSAPIVQ
ncbi:hypothetical protein RND81_05G015000 [Saponaria officinalis]|uniref:Retrotransposon gag domain-containing protein n=1 Tax=Saponaria officinalis TaxID=3572 RepID=A0AAW1KTG1_SAPOF